MIQLLLRSNPIPSQLYTILTGEIRCLVGMTEIVVVYLRGSVTKVDMDGVLKKNRIWVATLGFELQLMLGVFLCVSGSFTVQLSCGTWSKLA